MTEKQEEVEMTEPAETEIVEQETPQEPKEQTPEDVAAELDDTRKALAKANREAAQRRKKLETYEKADQERKEAELSEMEKLQKQLADREAELNKLTITELKRSIAEEIGLPTAFAKRIQGDNEEAMREDAKSLLDAIPASKKPIKSEITNPGDATKGKTDNQRRAELYRGDMTDPFDAEAAKSHGGGVHFITGDK